MAKLSPRTLRCGAALLALLLAVPKAASSLERRFKRLKGQTVMITVTRRDQSVANGAGVVLCQADGRVRVVTAYHLFLGPTPGRKVLRRPARTEIRFYGGSLPSVVDQRPDPFRPGDTGRRLLTFHQMPEHDLVLLSFPFSPKLRSTAATMTLRTFLGVGDRGDGPPAVFAIGHRNDSMQSWDVQQGTLLAGDGGEFLHHTAQVDEGFAGGPLFSKAGALVGVHLRRVAGAEIGAGASDLYGQALPVKEVLRAVGRWVSGKCLDNIDLKHPAWGDSPEPPPRGPVPRPPDLTAAKKMKVRGRYGYREELSFKPFRVTRVRRGLAAIGSSRRRPTYEFSFDEADGNLWRGECIVGVKRKGPPTDPDGQITLELSRSASLICKFENDGAESAERIVISEPSRADRAMADAAAVVPIDVAPSPSGGPADYLFHAADQLLGAVELDGDGIVWLHPAASGRTRSAFLVAAAALLLNPDFQ